MKKVLCGFLGLMFLSTVYGDVTLTIPDHRRGSVVIGFSEKINKKKRSFFARYVSLDVKYDAKYSFSGEAFNVPMQGKEQAVMVVKFRDDAGDEYKWVEEVKDGSSYAITKDNAKKVPHLLYKHNPPQRS